MWGKRKPAEEPVEEWTDDTPSNDAHVAPSGWMPRIVQRATDHYAPIPAQFDPEDTSLTALGRRVALLQEHYRDAIRRAEELSKELSEAQCALMEAVKPLLPRHAGGEGE